MTFVPPTPDSRVPAVPAYAAPASPAYPTPVAPVGIVSPGAFPYGTQPPVIEKPKTVGVIAMIVSLVVFVLSPIASVLVGLAAGPLATTTENSFSISASTSSTNPAIALFGFGVLAHILLGSLLGGWGLVQGIIATATRRGRVFGIVAIVVAAVAPIVSLIVYFVTLGISASQL